MASVRRYLWILRGPCALTVFISLVSGVAFNWPLGDVAFNFARICILVFAVWLLVRGGITNLWSISLAGFLLFFVDHLVVKGGSFLISGEIMAFFGVLISFVMFVAIPMAITAFSGYILRRRSRSVSI